MENLYNRDDRIRQYLLEDLSEGDLQPPEDNNEEIPGSDNEEEDHQSDSDHNTNSSHVDDTDADADFIPDSDEMQAIEGSSDDNNSDPEPMNTEQVALDHPTVDAVIEDVVMGDGGIIQVSESTRRNRACFIGKDRKTVWYKHDNNRTNIRTRSVNIVTHVPGPIRNAKETKAPLECFNLFIDQDIINTIVTSTNIFVVKLSNHFSRERDCRQTDDVEIRSFLGLLIFAGAIRSGHQNLEDLWKRDGTGLEIFYGTMSLRRFFFLLQTIRFDNIHDREERRKLDKLAAFREVYDMFISHCENNFSLGEYVTIDEQLVPFRGRCSFRQYIKSKPARYGLKIFTLADAKLFYVKTMEIYLGKQPDESPYKLSPKPDDVVLRLVRSINNSGRNVTADNWFTSIPLVNQLLQMKLSYVGTIRKNKAELPSEMIQKKRNAYSSIFGFQEKMTLVSYAPKKDKSVVLISSMHHDSSIDATTGIQKKPEIVMFYNMTKSGVDIVDEKCGTYSTSRRCKRWPLALFYRLIDISGINAQVIFLSNNPDSKLPRRQFLKEVAIELIKPHALRRTSILSLPKNVRQSAQKVSRGRKPCVNAAQNPAPRKKQRCSVCPRSKDIKINTYCESCKSPMCIKHMKHVCEPCFSKEMSESE